ncbi:MAG: acyl-CoA synthetase [Hyphomicrobiaceae bacterium]
MMADLEPDKPAVIMADSGETITFRVFEEYSNQFANLLRELSIRHGHGLAVLLENRLEYLPLVWGGMRAGLRVTAIATHLTPDEIAYILADSGAKALVTSKVFAEKMTGLSLPKVATNRRLMLDTADVGFRQLEPLLQCQPRTPIADQAEGVEMLYSSGTTGRPKGIKKPLPQTPFGTLSPTYRRSVSLYDIDASTRYLSPAPLYHAAPLGFNLRTLRVGGTTVIMRKFDAEQALALIDHHGITHSQWVPTHFVRLLRLSEDARARHGLSTHRCAIHAAAPCPIEVKRQMINWWGPILQEYYAGSEGNGHTSIASEDWLTHPGSVGRPSHGKVHICDEDGHALPTGAEGMIFFEGGATFEYHNDPDKTAASRNHLGWSTLGDIGYLDEEGYLYLTDRKAHMIISGGVNIYPQEAENVLVLHPKIYDAAVIGVPNEEFGEEVKAVVQLVDLSQADSTLEAELIAHCRTHLSPVKCPKSIDFVSSLPRQENGKLYKRKLRDAYWEKNHEQIT